MHVTPAQLTELLTKMITKRHPLLITGKPGAGKTDIARHVAENLCKNDFIVTHPVVEDPTDRKGIPWPDAKTLSCLWLTDDVTKQLCTATRPTTWLIDDLGQASPAVQAVHMQWLLNRGVNGHKLSDFVTVLAATNRRADRAGVSGILEPVKSRFVSIVELEPVINDWCAWAIDHDIPAMLIAFLRYRPELLCKFEASADLTNSPVPRTWANLAKLEELNLSPAVETIAFAGAVGEAAAGEYLAFRQMANSIVNVDAIILTPDTVKIPTKPNELYATVTALAGRATNQNFARVGTYATRLAVEARRGEFAVLLLRDAIRRNEKLTYNETFTKLSCGPIGELMAGN
jgi:hypothetical protein